MSYLSVLCRRVVLLGLQPSRRLAHSGPPRRQHLSPAETAVGILMIFSAFLAPAAYGLTSLSQFRKQ
ncbi:PREDICTED: cytochrome c oxidase subunit 8C, mitochondrial [Chinchilla lanigera]|uniref:cytochrome c oxidase subunit 8C, mitochondrial n=1 Tax=Chinchilla lanigera TaxID=34839 RepID=UPI00038EAB89|nr:PREDICTED: cytochrome c oxidase subunit 8C, mitochondrial [Chinchilla lanigera]